MFVTSIPQCLALSWTAIIVSALLYVRDYLLCLNIVDVWSTFVAKIVSYYSHFQEE